MDKYAYLAVVLACLIVAGAIISVMIITPH